MNYPKRFAGMLQIVRFNPWFYAVGTVAVIGGGAVLTVGGLAFPAWIRWVGIFCVAMAAWWLAASLIVSYLVYDLSDWPRGTWLAQALCGMNPARVLNVHSGFDETTERLRRWLPETTVIPLDLFDKAIHTERSLCRARAFRPPCEGTLTAHHHAWPEDCGECDVIFLLLTAHEFRTAAQRRELLIQARATLKKSATACVVLAEHTRDFPNLMAFGPGFLHFHSAKTWREDWNAAGLSMEREFRVTPFLHVWTLRSKEAR